MVSVYAGAHRRRECQGARADGLARATGILAHLAGITREVPPRAFEARHVKAIVEAYHRAGLRAEGLFEVMSAAWALRWGEPFESEADMVEFLTTLTPDSSPGPELSLFQQEKRAGQLRH